jgi:hypothetical protein
MRTCVWALLTALAAGADPGACTTEVVPGVVVEIRDAENDTRVSTPSGSSTTATSHGKRRVSGCAATSVMS